MRIFFPDKFLSQARSHQALELIKRLKPDQLAGPRMDRYVFKEVGRRSFLAIGTEQTISDQQVFIWLQVLHRNSREWREFQWEPARYGARVLQPALSALLPEVRIWLDQPPEPLMPMFSNPGSSRSTLQVLKAIEELKMQYYRVYSAKETCQIRKNAYTFFKL